jgi:hypothetical protein
LPRISVAARSIAISPIDRLAPPPELSEAEARVFRQTVATVAPGYFAAEDLVLLCAYARTAVLERQAAEQLAATMAAGGKTGSLAAVHTQVARTLMNLAIRLRIGPRARAPGDNSRRRSAQPGSPSFYETMALPGDDES